MRTVTTRTVGGRVNTDGTQGSGGEFTSRRTGLGQYVVTVASGLRLIAATAAPQNFAVAQVNAVAPSLPGASFTVSTATANTGSAVDSPFQFTAQVAA